MGLYGFNQKRQCHEGDDEGEVIAHLHMVGHYLQRHEEGRDECAPQITSAVTEHHAGDGGRDVGQSVELPDVTGADDDEVIAGESPHHSTEGGHPRLEVEGTQEDIEAQQHHKHQHHIVREVELVEPLHAVQPLGGGV